MGSKKSSSSAPPAPWTKGYDPKGSGRWKNAGGTMFSKGPSGSMGAARRGKYKDADVAGQRREGDMVQTKSGWKNRKTGKIDHYYIGEGEGGG